MNEQFIPNVEQIVQKEEELKYEDVRGRMWIPKALSKPDKEGDDYALQQFEKAIGSLVLFGDTENKLRNSFGRNKYHFLRMLDSKRSDAEQKFARAFLNEEDKYFTNTGTENDRRLVNICSGEGNNTTMFWTFAPYIYKAIVSDGKTRSNQAIEMIMNWVQSAENTEDGYNISLPGLEKYNDEDGFMAWGLDLDQNSLSHTYTAREAKKLAVEIVENAPESARYMSYEDLYEAIREGEDLSEIIDQINPEHWKEPEIIEEIEDEKQDLREKIELANLPEDSDAAIKLKTLEGLPLK